MLIRALYRAYRRNAALRAWIGQRLTPAGVFVLGALAAAAVLGIDTFQSLAYQAFALCGALLGVALVLTVRFRPPVEVRRALPRLCTAGETLGYRIVVRSRAARPLAGLTVREALPDPRPSFEEFRDTPVPGEERDGWADRAVKYRRWQRLVALRRGALVDEMPIPALPPGGEAEVRARLTPVRRGYVRLAGLTVARPDPLGLARAAVSIAAPHALLVLPRRYRVPPIDLPGSRRYQPGGVALASSVGDSEEFASLREYRPGDPLRRIHWRSWARLGKPIVKEFQDEFFVRHGLVLDTFGAAGEAFEEAVSVAASFAASIRSQDSLLDLMFVGPEAYCFTAGRGTNHVEKMLEVLACVGPCQERGFETLHQLVAARGPSLSGVIAVLLAWDAARQALVRHLRSLEIPMLAFVVATGPGEATLADGVRRLEAGRIAEGLAGL